jgi:transcriptional antiterminator RfaH
MSDNGLQPSWYVVQTQPHAESKAAAQLQRQGFNTYLPRFEKRRRHARRVEVVASPLFPRYLFVAVDRTMQRWRAIQSTIGVSRLVCNGDVPAAVPRDVVEGLQGREDARGFVQLQARPRFSPGESVRIIDGVFNSCLAIYEGMTGGERVAVMLDLLGRKVRVVVDDLAVAAA